MSPTSVDWRAVRARFPALDGPDARAYLDTASIGLPPRVVLEEVRAALEQWGEGKVPWRTWEARAEQAREAFAALLGVATDRVALTGSLSAAAAQVASSLPDPREGRDALVVGEAEFRSNLYPWWTQERRGFRLVRVPFRGGRPDPEALHAAIDERTALVAVSHVQSATGAATDLPALARRCEEQGARLFVDGTQSVGAVSIALDGIDCLATHAYKWLLAPRGATFAVFSERLLAEQIPVQPSWRTPPGPQTDYYGGPFEAGPGAAGLDASLSWLVWVGAAPALELLGEIGPEAIGARTLELSGAFRAGLEELGLSTVASEEAASPIVTVRAQVPGGADALRVALEDHGVVASIRSGQLRTSFHLYNDERDVERALDALRATLR